MPASRDRDFQEGTGLLAAAGAILVAVVLVWSLDADPIGLPGSRAWRTLTGLLASVALAGGSGYLGYRFEHAWAGALVTLSLPLLLIEPWAWGRVSIGDALTPCCTARGASLVAGVAWILGAGARRVRETVAEWEPRPRALVIGLALVVTGVALIGIAAGVPEWYLPVPFRQLSTVGTVAVLAGTGFWGFRLRAWWPAAYLVGAGLLRLLPEPWEVLAVEGGWVVATFSVGIGLLPAASYLVGAVVGRIVSEA